MSVDVQREKGHLDLANPLVKRFCSYRLSGQEWQILWVVFHKTWGFVVRDKERNIVKDENGTPLKKKTDKIPLSQFSKLTGLDRRRCHALLDSLIDRQIISKRVTNKGDKTIITYGIQKDYSKWKVSPKKVTASNKGDKTPKKPVSVTNNGDRVSPIMVAKVSPILTPSKEKKETLSKEAVIRRKFENIESSSNPVLDDIENAAFTTTPPIDESEFQKVEAG